MLTFEKILNSTSQLPCLPEVSRVVLQLVNDPKSSASDIVEVVRHDQSITANALRICNSAYFALKRKIDSLSEAVVLLGQRQMVEIVMIGSCMHLFGKGHSGYIKTGLLWHHSVASGILSQIILKQTGALPDHGLYTSALLHDVGKVVLDEFLKGEYQQVVDSSETDKIPVHVAEQNILGLNHAEVGARLMETWNFPPNMVEATRNHHSHSKDWHSQEFTPLVCLCNAVCSKEGIGRESVDGDKANLEEYMKAAHITEQLLQSCVEELWSELKKLEEVFGLKK